MQGTDTQMADNPSQLIKELRGHMLDYIEEHPYAIKQELFDYCDVNGFGSRKIVSRELKYLHSNGRIDIKRDKANSQRHKLVLNYDDEIYKVSKRLDALRDVFFRLIEELKTKDRTGILAGEEIERVESLDFGPDEQDKILPAYDLKLAHQSLNILLQHMLGMFVLYFLFEWPEKITDTKARNELYSLTFKTISEISTKISHSLPSYNVFSSTTFRNDLVNRMFLLNPYRLSAILMNLKTLGIREQSETVVDALWELGAPFVPDIPYRFRFIVEEGSKGRHITKDWRKAVKITDKLLDNLDGGLDEQRNIFLDDETLPP